MNALVEEARARTIALLRDTCATPLGFKASGLQRGYPHVWARDSGVIGLGALAVNEPVLIDALRASLATLARHQTGLGMIPLNVQVATDSVTTENAGATDANLWYVLGHFNLWRATGDLDTLRGAWDSIDRALLWLRYQDMNDCGLLEVPEAGDWMDLLAVRYNVLYDNVLWCGALRAFSRMSTALAAPETRTSAAEADQLAAGVKERLNLLMWIDRCWEPEHFAEHLGRLKAMRLEWYMLYHNIGTISSRPYYLPWVAFREYGDYCDVLGNMLAVLFGIADGERQERIMRHLYQVGVARPFPSKAIHPPIFPGEANWREYYRSRNLNLPHQYHNGGIWPMIGGFHVAALVKMGWMSDATNLLNDLAVVCSTGVNAPWEFKEWMNGETGNPMGYALQGWSASMYLYAYEAVKTGRVAMFDDLSGA